MIENEAWGTMPLAEFKELLAKFTKLFGEPRKSKRMALRFGPNKNMGLNTRIRITDGDAKIMQKVHERNELTAIENELDIPNDAEYILNLFKTYKFILQNFDEVHFRLLRFENNIFDTPDFEIKVTHQFGNQDIYSFEVEAKSESADVLAFCKEHNLVSLTQKTDDEFWVDYNKKVNVDIAGWSDKELKGILEEYLTNFQ